MALAEVTYNVGISYRIGSYVFPLNKTVLVSDSSTIQRALTTKGFSVHMLEKKRGRKKGKKTVPVEKTSAGETKRAGMKKKPAKVAAE